MPTNSEIQKVNKAMSKLCDQLDEFEKICAVNGMHLQQVTFTNRPNAERSEFRVVYLGNRTVIK